MCTWDCQSRGRFTRFYSTAKVEWEKLTEPNFPHCRMNESHKNLFNFLWDSSLSYISHNFESLSQSIFITACIYSKIFIIGRVLSYERREKTWKQHRFCRIRLTKIVQMTLTCRLSSSTSPGRRPFFGA